MQRVVKVWVADQVKRLGIKGRVLEIGSYDVNGNLNAELAGCDHVRLDMRKGPNVDIVANSHNLPFASAVCTGSGFDAVVCADTLEHDSAFWVTMKEIRRVLKPGGAIVLCVPYIGFPLHQHPSDYWRFTESSMRELLSDCTDIEVKVWDKKKPYICEVFGAGRLK
jgi:SAM-dependent methyltransferase